MKLMDKVLALVEAALRGVSIYYFLYCIKNDDINLVQSSVILLVLGYAAAFACPWFRHTNAWKQMCREK
ncbi:MAG: hypothetical protein ACHQVS_04225 [Candidatus Babeliales bacterium]